MNIFVKNNREVPSQIIDRILNAPCMKGTWIAGCYPEILGRWHFKGIGNNKRLPLLIKRAKHVPNTVRNPGANTLVWSRVEALEVPAISRYLRPKIANSGLLYCRNVLQNKQVATSEDSVKSRRSVEKSWYFQNGLTYPNKIS